MAYIPSPQDLLWTLQNIQSNSMWAVPSGGSVFLFRHEEFEFKSFTVAEKTDVQMQYFKAVSTNLLSLGYREVERRLCPGVNTTSELLQNYLDFTEDDLERALFEGLRKRPHDDRFDER